MLGAGRLWLQVMRRQAVPSQEVGSGRKGERATEGSEVGHRASCRVLRGTGEATRGAPR